jgi:hypothetical protein
VMARTPILRDLPARLVGFGVGRPRIESPALARPADRSARRGGAVSGGADLPSFPTAVTPPSGTEPR